MLTNIYHIQLTLKLQIITMKQLQQQQLFI